MASLSLCSYESKCQANIEVVEDVGLHLASSLKAEYVV